MDYKQILKTIKPFLKQYNLTQFRASFYVRYLQRNHNNIYKEIINNTKWLPHKSQIVERIYCYVTSTIETPKCQIKICNNHVRWSIGRGYLTFCSGRCAMANMPNVTGFANTSQNPKVKQKKRKSSRAKFGTNSPTQHPSIRKKITNSLIEHYKTNPKTKKVRLPKVKKSKAPGNILIDNPGRCNKCNSLAFYVTRKGRYWCNEYSNSCPVMKTLNKTIQTNRTPERKQEIVENIQKAKRGKSKRKLFTFPSGNIVSVQGYEPWALELLLKNGIDETDITVNFEEMPKTVYFFKEKQRRYFPDIYIKSQNKIIEVKSTYIFIKDYEQNLAKYFRCKSLGIEMEFYIFEDNKQLVPLSTMLVRSKCTLI